MLRTTIDPERFVSAQSFSSASGSPARASTPQLSTGKPTKTQICMRSEVLSRFLRKFPYPYPNLQRPHKLILCGCAFRRICFLYAYNIFFNCMDYIVADCPDIEGVGLIQTGIVDSDLADALKDWNIRPLAHE